MIKNIISRSILGILLFAIFTFLIFKHNILLAFLLIAAISFGIYEIIFNFYKTKVEAYTRLLIITLINYSSLIIYLNNRSREHIQYYLIIASIFYTVILWLVKKLSNKYKKSLAYDPIFAFYFIFLPLMLIITAIYLQLLLFYILLIVTIFDTSAFFIGKFYGQNYPFPALSKKSIEGYIGGWLITIVLLFLFKSFVSSFDDNIGFIFITIACILAAIGDLLESAIKRSIGVKDSGKILLGHGGILDRIDALLLANLTIYLYGYSILLF